MSKIATNKSELLHAAALTLAQRELAREEYIHYCTYINDKFEVNWHHVLIAEAVDRLFLPLEDPYHLRRLLISMPPRHGKSELLSRILPGFAFMRQPDMDIIFASYSASIAERVSGEAKRYLESDKYKALTDVRLPTNKQKGFSQLKEFWQTINGGSFKAVGTGGSLTGSGAQLIVCDDLVKDRQSANSAVSREALKNWYTSVLRTRVTGDCRIIVLGTMWHASDILNDLINSDNDENIPDADKEHWHKIILPATYDGSNLCGGDPRRIEGEALWPTKYSKHSLAIMKANISQADWDALYMCKPGVSGDAEIDEKYFDNILINELPQDIQASVIGVDPALGNSEIGDRSSICYMSRCNDNRLNTMFIAERMNVSSLLDNLTECVKRMKPDAVAIEVTGFQQLLLTQIKQRFAASGLSTPVIPIKQNIKKEIRIRRLVPYIENGTLKVLNNKSSKTFIKEAKEFPVGATDDLLDSCEIALRLLVEVVNNRVRRGIVPPNLGTVVEVPEVAAPRTTPPPENIVISAQDMNKKYNIPEPKQPKKKWR